MAHIRVELRDVDLYAHFPDHKTYIYDTCAAYGIPMNPLTGRPRTGKWSAWDDIVTRCMIIEWFGEVPVTLDAKCEIVNDDN